MNGVSRGEERGSGGSPGTVSPSVECSGEGEVEGSGDREWQALGVRKSIPAVDR